MAGNSHSSERNKKSDLELRLGQSARLIVEEGH